MPRAARAAPVLPRPARTLAAVGTAPAPRASMTNGVASGRKSGSGEVANTKESTNERRDVGATTSGIDSGGTAG